MRRSRVLPAFGMAALEIAGLALACSGRTGTPEDPEAALRERIRAATAAVDDAALRGAGDRRKEVR